MVKTLQVTPGRFSKLAELGFNIFPAKPGGKEPVVKWKTRRDNPPSTSELQNWDASTFNVAVITGTPSGIIVIDSDSPEAEAFLATLNLPNTWTVKTAKGKHYYFKHPGCAVSNRVRVNGLKLDVRGDGGYVIAPGSIHESGVRYEWEVSPDNTPLAELPSDLLDLLRTRKRPAFSAGASDDAGVIIEGRFAPWLSKRLRDATNALKEAREGSRNDTLFRVGVRLARDFVAAKVDWAAAAGELTKVALEIGLEPAEIERTLQSCWDTAGDDPTPWITIASDWVYVAGREVFYHLENGQQLRQTGFNNAFAQQRVSKGTLSSFLLDNGFIRVVQDLAYEPESADLIVTTSGLDYLNSYKAPNIVAVPGDWQPFIEFLEYLIPDPGERHHLIRSLAWVVRNPGRKLRYALMIRSKAQGIGKSMLSDILAALLGSDNARKTSTEQISSPYQTFLKRALLIVVEELNWGAGPTLYNRLKSWITEDFVPINEKYHSDDQHKIHATFMILTNLETPIMIEASDRRFAYYDTPAGPRPPEYYRELASWWQANLGVIRAYFDSVDLEGFDPYAPPPMTEAKRELISSSRPDLVQDLALAIEEGVGVFDRDIMTLDDVKRHLGRGAWSKSDKQIISALKGAGAVNLGQSRVGGIWSEHLTFLNTPGTRVSLWAVRNVSVWECLGQRERGEEYERKQGLLALFRDLKIDAAPLADLLGS